MTPLDISNVALALIGHRATVASIDPPEQSIEAQQCALFWPTVRDYTLSCHTWSFLVTRTTLAVLGVTPPAPFQYAYAYPADCLRFIGVRDPNASDDIPNLPCRLGKEGAAQVIYANQENAVGVYLKRETNAAQYPTSLVLAQQYMMAARLAGSLVQGAAGIQIGQRMEEMAQGYLAQAKKEDASQGNLKDVLDPSKYTASHLTARGLNGTTETPIIRS